MLLGNFGKI